MKIKVIHLRPGEHMLKATYKVDKTKVEHYFPPTTLPVSMSVNMLKKEIQERRAEGK